jgi:hypothetical protein
VVVLPIKIRPGRCYLDIFELAFSLLVKMLASVYFAKYLLHFHLAIPLSFQINIGSHLASTAKVSTQALLLRRNRVMKVTDFN